MKITKKEKLYIAGYFDAKMLLELKGKTTTSKYSKRQCRLGVTSDDKDFILRLQELFGGNIHAHYKSSYKLALNKTKAVKFFQEIGGYLILKKDKVLEFVDFCKLALRVDPSTGDYYRGTIMPPEIEFVDHENNIDYVKGYIDARVCLGINKNVNKSRNRTRWLPKLEFLDDNGYINKFLKLKNFDVNYTEKSMHGADYKTVHKTGENLKALIKYLLPLTKQHKEQYKIILDCLNGKDPKTCRDLLIESKIFNMDESILSTNPDSQKLKEKKQEKLKARAKERIAKRLEVQREERQALFESKVRQQRSITRGFAAEMETAIARYEKEKQKLEDIESDYKFCPGLQKELHKDNFNINKITPDGLCTYSRDFYNEKKKSGTWSSSVRSYNEERRLNPLERLSDSIHVQLHQCLKGKEYKSSIWRYLGFTINHLKTHLESQFTEGMSWDNYGQGWHVDHIKPKDAFCLEEEEELLKCWGLDNLQPLWASDNLTKSNKYEEFTET